MPEEFEIAVSLNTAETLEIRSIIKILKSLEDLLKDIERNLRDGGRVQAKWKWPEEPDLRFTATVNGIDEDMLDQIVVLAREGFQRAKEASSTTTQITWPDAFGERARNSIRTILEHLERVESLTVRTTGNPPLEIHKARIDQTFEAHSRRRVFSAVDGLLEMIGHRGNVIKAGIRENFTGRYVRCTLVADTWRDHLRDEKLWDQRVVVEGRIAYDDQGHPLSVVDVTKIAPRERGRPLKDLEGADPDFTKGLSTEDFIGRLRGDD